MTEQSNVINIDGKKYNSEDLSAQQIRWVQKLQSYAIKQDELRETSEEISVLQTQYLGRLKSSLEQNNDEGQEEKAG
jgi:hypothetical protein